MDHYIIKSIVTFRSEGHQRATGHLSRIQAVQKPAFWMMHFCHIPQESTGVSNLVFFNYIFVAREANLILSREGYRTDCH